MPNIGFRSFSTNNFHWSIDRTETEQQKKDRLQNDPKNLSTIMRKQHADPKSGDPRTKCLNDRENFGWRIKVKTKGEIGKRGL
jgi:hypothetical protein